jgi:hypothetical protein
MSINKLCKSSRAKEHVASKGFTLPQSPTTISDKLKQHANKLKEEIKKELKELIQLGTRFTVTLDEWTSARNRRYINANLHSKEKHWNLGMARINGSLPAEATIKLLVSKLEEFGIDAERHIIAATSDGASIMLKFGRIAPFAHQVCLVHGLHLAVTKVLYPKKKTDSKPKPDTFDESGDEIDYCPEEDGNEDFDKGDTYCFDSEEYTLDEDDEDHISIITEADFQNGDNEKSTPIIH